MPPGFQSFFFIIAFVSPPLLRLSIKLSPSYFFLYGLFKRFALYATRSSCSYFHSFDVMCKCAGALLRHRMREYLLPLLLYLFFVGGCVARPRGESSSSGSESSLDMSSPSFSSSSSLSPVSKLKTTSPVTCTAKSKSSSLSPSPSLEMLRQRHSLRRSSMRHSQLCR